MELFRDSYYDKEINEKITQLIGKRFTLWQAIKMNGKGSPRLQIIEATGDIMNLLSHQSSINYANIELRIGGIIIRFKARQDNYALVIPFSKMHIETNDKSITFSESGEHIKLSCFAMTEAWPTFLSKLHRFRSEFPDRNDAN